jgi:hypothetical protein
MWSKLLSTETAKQVNDRVIFFLQNDVIYVKKYVKTSRFKVTFFISLSSYH